MSESFAPFVRQLQADLAGNLPGRSAQYMMAPQPRSGGDLPYDRPHPDARRGGVLVLCYPHEATIYVALILRPTYNGVHSGQVAFPGGGYESGDQDLTQTALREAYEEIGVEATTLTLLGQLSPLYIYASNYLVFPTVAWANERPQFKIDPYEVAALLEIPLRDLCDPSNCRQEEWQLIDRVAQVPFFALLEQKIWGATAMILSEFLALPAVQQFASPSLPNIVNNKEF
jgi:8-oxo-dGTP pyrophosphatase MutT (NUDIX family)